jgi:asparagine synthase (glutamine-hydrolysing)
MSGFSGILLFNRKHEQKLIDFDFPNYVNSFYKKKNEIKEDGFVACHYSNDKFSNDKFLNESNICVLGFDGVRLGGTELDFDSSKDEMLKSILSVKGSFTAFYFNKNNKELILIADQMSSRQFFYFANEEFAAFSSSIFLLSDILRHFGTKLSLSEPASYMMLSLGYMLEDFTLINEIKKIKAGEYVYIANGKSNNQGYHNYYRDVAYTNINIDLLSELDHRFKKSIDLEYSKDLHYNYEHIATLSGGLDSRLNVMLAHEYDFKDITALTFSEGFKSDELIARKISSDLSLKHIVLLLNNGFQLYDIETPLMLNNCAVYYFGAAQTLAAVSRINLSSYGLLHNGGLAESSKGGYIGARHHESPSLRRRYAVSDKLFNRIDEAILNRILHSYPNDEMFVTYNRGFNAIHNGAWMTLPFTDTTYTYMDLEFAQLAYSIDPALRFEGKLTIDWMQNKHPRLMMYPWKYGIKPTNSSSKLLIGKVVNKLKRELLGANDVPVPFDDWYKKDITLRAFVDDQYNNSISWEFIPKSIGTDIEFLFNQGTIVEKFLCISFLKSVEMIFVRNA